MEYFKRQSLHKRTIGDTSVTLTADGEVLIQPEGAKTTVTGDLIVTGNATGPATTDILYVTQDGNDNNDGRSMGKDGAKATIKSAVASALPGTTIIVGPGDYYESNPITLPDFVTIRGAGDLRNTRIFPRNNTQTIFYMGNGCYLHELTFRALRYPGWCVEIRPGARVTTSPYVQNCTNMNGPWLNDGTEFIPFETVQIAGITPTAKPLMLEDYPDLPFDKQINDTGGGGGLYVDGNSYDPTSLVFSFVADAFTQISQGGIGFWIDNFGYTQIVSCFSVFCSVGFKATNGGYLSISNSVSDFGLKGIESDGFFPQAYTTTRAEQNYYSTVASVTIQTAGAGYTSAPDVSIEAPSLGSGTQATATATIDATTGKLSAITIQNAGSGYTSTPLITVSGGGASAQATAIVNLAKNITIRINSLRDKPQTGSIIKFEADPTYYYITGNTQINPPFIYDETVCRRDLKRIIDAVTSDIVLGTSYQSQAAGTSYLRSTSSKVLSDQKAPTIYGIEQARDGMKAQTTNLAMEENIDYLFNIITSTISEGDSSVQPDNSNDVAATFNDLQTIDPAKIQAKNNILENREFLVEEVSAYINDQFTELSYNQATYTENMTTLIDGIEMFATLESNQQVIRAAQEFELRTRFKPMLLSSFRYLSDKFEALSAVAASSIALQNVKEGFNQFMNIIDDGDSSANVIVFPEHAGVDNNRADAKDQVIANKNFLIAEFKAFLSAEVSGFSYDDAKYTTDLENIIDAATFDVLYGGNSSTVQEAKYYFANGAGGVAFSTLAPVNRAAIVNAFARLRFVIQRVVRGLAVTPTSGNGVTQDFSSNNATQSEADFLDTLIFNIQDMIDNLTLSRLPATLTKPIYTDEPALQIQAGQAILLNRDNFITDAIAYNLANNPTLTYDQDKCRRDVGYIVDAVNRDILLGTNTNSIQAGRAYKRSNTAYLNVEQKPATILGLRKAKALGEAAVISSTTIKDAVTARWEDVLNIIENDELPSEGLTYPDPGPATNELIYGVDQVIANKAFLQEELVAYINANNYVYDKDKCKRDTGLIIDAAAYDTLLGTNYNQRVAGLSYQRANSAYLQSNQKTQTVAGINFAKSKSSDATTHSPSQSTVEAAFDEVIDIINNGAESTEQAADPLTLTNPSTATTGQINARLQLQANRNFIAKEAVAYVNSNYVNYTYDVAKCQRDTGLIIDAVARDVALGTNYNSVTAGLAYSRASALTNKQAQGIQTLAAFEFVRKETIEKGLSDTGEARALAGYNEVIDIFRNGVLSTDVSADAITFTNPTGASQDLIDAKDQLQANREFIAQEVLAYVNANNPKYDVSAATYNQSTGDMVLTIGSHSYTTDDYIRLGKESLAFSCTYGQGNHTYVGGTATNAVQSGGNYTHSFVSAVTNGVTSNAGNLPNAVTGATYNAATGEMIITSASHLLTTSNTLSIADNALSFTCTMDGNTSTKTYPRSTDPASGATLAISAVTTDTITINVGASPIVNHDVTNATYNYATGILEMTIGSHSLEVGTSVKIANDSLTFTCDADGNATNHTYPRSTDPARDTALPITAKTGTTISVNVGIISSSTSSTKKYPRNNTDPAYNANLRITAVGPTTITVNVGPNTTNPTAHTFESATPGAVTTGYNQDKCLRDARYLVDALSHDILYGGNTAIRTVALSYFDDGNPQLPNAQQKTAIVNAFQHIATNIIGDIVQNIAVAPQRIKFTPGAGTTYDPNTGLLKLAVGSHNLQLSDLIKIEPNGVTFSCTYGAGPHTYVGGTVSNAITITAGSVQRDVTNATYNHATGVMEMTIGAHSFTTSDTVTIATNALTFTCDADGNATNHTYPRVGDPAEGTAIAISAVTGNTITVNVGAVGSSSSNKSYPRATDPAIQRSFTPATGTTYNPATGELVLEIGSHSLDTNTQVVIAPNSMIFTCTTDPSKPKLYPRRTDPAHKKGLDITAVTPTTITVNVGVSSDTNPHTFVTANTNSVTTGLLPITALDATSITVDVGTSSATETHTWVSSVTDCVSVGNFTEQDTSNGPASSSEVSALEGDITIVTDAITANTASGIPAEVLPSVTWASTTIQADYNTIVANKSALQTATTDYITEKFQGFNFNATKCERDTKYIVDALTYDVLYGGNSATVEVAKSYWVGTQTQVSDQKVETATTVDYVGQICDEIIRDKDVDYTWQGVVNQDKTNGPGTIAEVARVQSLCQIIEDVIQNGLDNIPSITYPDYPQWVDTDVVQGIANLFNEKETIKTQTVDYIDATYNGYSYDQEKCKQDTGFLIDAITHDSFYESNIQTLIATRAYFLGSVNYLPAHQVANTVLAYTHLQSVIDDCIQGVAVSKSPGNPLNQVLSGNYGNATVANTFKGLIDITKNAINNGNLIGTPADIEPNYSWISQSTRDSCLEFFSQKAYYQTEVINYLNTNVIGFTYNIDKCKRDTGYIIDAAVYDMVYGGDKQTQRAATAYYSGTVLQVTDSTYTDQCEITAYANYYLADIIAKVAINDTVTKSFGNPINQIQTIPDGSTLVGTATFPGATCELLINRLADSILTKSVGDWFERDHDLSLGNSIFLTERENILAAEQTIVDNAISALNLQYGGRYDINLFPGIISVTTDKLGSLHNVSTVSTSGHAFEYVGAGVTYNALPFFGGTAIPSTEIIQTNQGKVFAGGTVDQIGNFRVGDFFGVNALTGSITLNANEIDLSGLTSVGPFIRNGIPVGVELKEVSDNEALISSLGTQDLNTAPTQRAVSAYVEARYLNKLTGGTISGNVTLNGNFDVNGSVISTTSTGAFDLLNTNATTVNAFGQATAINIGAPTGLVTINPDLTVQGVLTVNGNLIFTGDVAITIPDEELQAYSITEGTEDYVSINTRSGEEAVTFGQQPSVIISNTTDSADKDTGALVVDGGVGIEKNINVGGSADIDDNLTLGTDRTVNAHTIKGKIDIDIPDAGINNFRIHENLSEYLDIVTTDGSESIKLGTTPKLIVQNNTNATSSTTGAVQITGGLSTQQDIHAGNDITADRDLKADRDVEVNGTNIITDETGSFNVFNTNATTINAFGAATAVNLGAATGTLTLNNEVVIVDSVAGLQIPVGTTAQRPTNVTGRIRFNTTTNAFEGYDGVAWNSLGGVIDVDQNTYILAEDTPGADNNELDFYTEGTKRVTLSNTEFNIGTTTIVNVQNVTESTDYQTGALVVSGGAGIAKDLHVQGFIGGDNSGVLTLANVASDKILIKADTIESPESMKIITNAPDSAADDVVFPVSLAHHSISGSPTVGSGTGLKFELETSNNNFEVGGQIEVTAMDITGSQEDFDMVFKTMVNGTAGVEKLRISETTSTFTNNVQVDQGLFVTGVLDASSFRGSVVADDSTEIIDAINNKLTVVNGAIGTLSLTTDLEVQYGGTGRSSFVPNGIVYGDNTNQLQVTEAAGSADINTSFQMLTVTDSGDDTPIWTDTIDGGEF